MTPSELLEQADDLERDGAEYRHVQALRSYAELLEALQTIHSSGGCGANVMTPERILAWASDLEEA